VLSSDDLCLTGHLSGSLGISLEWSILGHVKVICMDGVVSCYEYHMPYDVCHASSPPTDAIFKKSTYFKPSTSAIFGSFPSIPDNQTSGASVMHPRLASTTFLAYLYSVPFVYFNAGGLNSFLRLTSSLSSTSKLSSLVSASITM
jgi:hypothetical protein